MLVENASYKKRRRSMFPVAGARAPAAAGQTRADRSVILSAAMSIDDSLPNDVATLQSMLVAERAARLARQSEAQYPQQSM
jgi:tagatose-1,6-bisphosphate aldolase non-catalytic subunit AgaZ/GatZ